MQAWLLAVVDQAVPGSSFGRFGAGQVGEEDEEVALEGVVDEPHGPHGLCFLLSLKLLEPPVGQPLSVFNKGLLVGLNSTFKK